MTARKRLDKTSKKTRTRSKRTLPKRDRKGRFKASASSRIRSVFRPRGKPSAAARQKRNKASRDKRPEHPVDVRADVRKGGMRPERVEGDYTHIINDGFDKREIAVINKSGGVDIVVQDTGRRYAAHYSGQNGEGRHNVAVDPRFVRDPETMTHETIHILQEVDPKRPAEDKELSIRKKDGLNDSERSRKEGLTEAETIARVQDPNVDRAAFYDSIDLKNAVALKEQDVKTIKGAMKGRSGGESPGVVASIFGKLHLSRYRHGSGKKK